MHGKFDKKLTLPADPDGQIEVKGPFEGDGDERDDAVIHFLIVQGGEDRQAPADQTVTVIGLGSWKKGQKEWSGTAPRKGRLPSGGDGWLQTGLARGIGLAIGLKPESLTKDDPPKFDPPSYQTLTWCADFQLVDGSRTAV
jgi:hypothetical protein